MKHISKDEMAKVIVDLTTIVAERSQGSALRGLTILATGFAGLLDVYAQPNEVNPQGMCDDPAAFRKYFAQVVIDTPRLNMKPVVRA